MSAPLFEIEGLHAATAEGDIEILRGVDLTVQEGGVHAPKIAGDNRGTRPLISIVNFRASRKCMSAIYL